MRRPLPAVSMAAAAIVVLLALGLVGLVVHEPRRVQGRGPARGTGIADVLSELMGFVERERGLPFLEKVDVVLVDDEEFDARLGSPDPDTRDKIEEVEAVLLAMGLVRPDVDLLAIVEEFAKQAVLGFYDAGSGELVVRGAEATPLARTTVVHELVHALEDQHFDLERPDLGDEAAAGLQALAEGSAVVVEERYVDSLSAAERRSAEGAELALGRGVVAAMPEVVQIAFGFPYAFGPNLVRAVLDAGGQPRLDQAFEDPPLSTEQVLDPARYLRGDDPRPVGAPRADRPAFGDGEIGELYLLLMLRAELTDRDARDAAQGWGGDHYVAWRDGARTCVRMRFVMDTPRDTDELEAALATWAAQRPATASASGTSLRTCS